MTKFGEVADYWLVRVKLTDQERAELERVCNKLDRKVGWVVSKAVSEYLERYKKQTDQK